jgi:carboxypeptidase C (cathepsin A)
MTVHGAGHMAPADKKEAVYQMIEAFIFEEDI